MYQTQKCWDWGKNKENFWNITSLKEKATGCPGMLCATWLHYGHSWRLSAPVCSCCFRCSAFPRRSWKPSFASKAWRKQDSHLVGPLESMPADPLWCLQEVYKKFLTKCWGSAEEDLGVLPDSFWPIALGNNLMNTRKSGSIFCVRSWLSSSCSGGGTAFAVFSENLFIEV